MLSMQTSVLEKNERVKSIALECACCSRHTDHVVYAQGMANAPSVRARVRAELIEEIKAAARQRLATEGPSALSLRAVARDVGMVSSAVYRYFPSRDELLTALIIDAYNTLGEHVEAAEAMVRRTDFRGRWMATAHAIRRWAVENEHEYGLVFGTPIPRYSAPPDTIGPANRATNVLIQIVREAIAAGAWKGSKEPVPRAVHADLAAARAFFGAGVDDDTMVRSLMAWTHIYGAISFELFGHRVGSVSNHEAFFDLEMRRIATFIGVV